MARKNYCRFRIPESLENRLLLTTLVDVDSDGDLDVVDGGGWQENFDGYGNFRLHPFAVVDNAYDVGDVDGDGDVDVVLPSVWLENVDGLGDFSLVHELASIPDIRASRVKLTDVAADGDLDLVVLAADRLVFYENTGGHGAFSLATDAVIEDLVDAGDIDNDGDIDAIALEHGSFNSIWLHRFSTGNGFEKELWAKDRDPAEDPAYAHTFARTHTIEFADVNSDGWLDVVSQDQGDGFFNVRWYRNQGLGERTAAENLWGCFGGCLFTLNDFDFDGDLDLLEHDGVGRISLRKNDGNANFQFSVWIPADGIVGGDINGDSFVDLMTGPTTWFDSAAQGIHVLGSLPDLPSPGLIVFEPHTNGASRDHDLAILDIDEDGDLDVVTSSFEFHENVDGTMIEEQEFHLAPRGNRWIDAHDIDNDGDLDIVAEFNGRVVWVESNGTQATSRRTIASQNRLRYAHFGDMNNDGLADMVYATRGAGVDGGSRVYIATNNGNGFSSTRIDADESTVLDVRFVDFDADGDMDVFTPLIRGSSGAVWYENNDGKFTEAKRVANVSSYLTDFAFADVNDDGKQDLVSISIFGDLIWQEDVNGDPKTVASDPDKSFNTVVAQDIDLDGDIDLLSKRGTSLYWFENTDGGGEFAPRGIIGSGLMGEIHVRDFDGDGDMDIVGQDVANRIVVFEAKPAGDINKDGAFDSSDIVLAFQRGEFDDDVYRNSNFDSGDWNGDREFDSKDLLFALGSESYVANAIPRMSDPLDESTFELHAASRDREAAMYTVK